MLIILPFIAFILVFINLIQKDIDWRRTYLIANILLGVFLTISFELLSIFTALNQITVAGLWIVVCLISALRIWIKRISWKTVKQVFCLSCPFSQYEKAAYGIVFGVFALLLVSGLLSPPNNTDSLQYHMARVAHWAQNGSLTHYATAFEPQLVNPIWAELAILNFRLLSSSDLTSSLIQWWSLLGCVIGVSAIAKQLGAGRPGQLLAAVFSLSIPMALLQATSTQNDLITALWLVCLAYFVISSITEDQSSAIIWLGLSLGLGMLTKGTFYPYAVPFGLWYMLKVLPKIPIKKSLIAISVVGICVVFLNAGYWARNIDTFGGPLGSTAWLKQMTNLSDTSVNFQTALTQNVLLNFATPFEKVNSLLLKAAGAMLSPAGVDLSQFQFAWGWNHEDYAGSPFHLVLGLVSTAVLVTRLNRTDQKKWHMEYILVVITTFLVLSFIVHYDPFGTRYQLPFLILSGPLVGLAFSIIRKTAFAAHLLIIILLLSTIPWVLFNRTRPVIAMRQNPQQYAISCISRLGCTNIGSIINEPKSSIVFANWFEIREPYLQMKEEVKTSRCQSVGLRIDSHDKEYLYWWLMSAPESGIRLESIYVEPHLSRFINNDFRPCAVICTICGDREIAHNLPLAGTFGDARLYLGTQFSHDLD